MESKNTSTVIKVHTKVRDELKKISNQLGMGTMGAVVAMLIRDYKMKEQLNG